MKLFGTRQDAIRYTRSASLAFAIIISASIFPIRSFQVAGGSMEPGLEDGEKILVEELTPRFADVCRGYIVVFRHPRNPARYLVKRVVGLSGETVEIRHGLLYVNGSRLREWYLPASYIDSSDLAPLRLGEGELFVMGDHRRESEDSRSWGPLRRGLVVGRAMISYWPPSAATYLRWSPPSGPFAGATGSLSVAR